MKRAAVIVALCAAFSAIAAPGAQPGAGPITKQNGSKPLFKDFTSICSVPGYAYYGNCWGDTTRYSNVTGRVNAVQAKAGVWNLGLSFTNLQPGALYKLWGNQSGVVTEPGIVVGFFPIATVVAALDGTARFSYQTTTPSDLGFDLNLLGYVGDPYGTTIVTSYWSNQLIQVLNPDGTLYVPQV